MRGQERLTPVGLGWTIYVNVMERRPPPAPARAWAILSPCWTADVISAIDLLLEAGELDIIMMYVKDISIRVPLLRIH